MKGDVKNKLLLTWLLSRISWQLVINRYNRGNLLHERL